MSYKPANGKGAKARRTHFSKSGKSMSLLRKAQADGGKGSGEVLELVQDVCTCWTSTYFMMMRLVLLYDYVHSIVSKSDKDVVRSLALSLEDIYQLRELSNALEPLCTVMQGMCASLYSTLSVVIDGADLDASEVVSP